MFYEFNELNSRLLADYVLYASICVLRSLKAHHVLTALAEPIQQFLWELVFHGIFPPSCL